MFSSVASVMRFVVLGTVPFPVKLTWTTVYPMLGTPSQYRIMDSVMNGVGVKVIQLDTFPVSFVSLQGRIPCPGFSAHSWCDLQCVLNNHWLLLSSHMISHKHLTSASTLAFKIVINVTYNVLGVTSVSLSFRCGQVYLILTDSATSKTAANSWQHKVSGTITWLELGLFSKLQICNVCAFHQPALSVRPTLLQQAKPMALSAMVVVCEWIVIIIGKIMDYVFNECIKWCPCW